MQATPSPVTSVTALYCTSVAASGRFSCWPPTDEKQYQIGTFNPGLSGVGPRIWVPSRPLRATVALPTPLGKEMVPVFSPDWGAAGYQRRWPNWLNSVRNSYQWGTISAMSSTVAILESPTGPDRRVPTWAAGLVAGLSRDMPTVVTRDDLAQRLVEVGMDRTVDSAVHELRRLGWLVTLPLHGVWAFVPPGVGEVLDPYIGLRAWRARDPDSGFMLCGATAAWHLGYLDHDPGSPVSVWIPSSTRLPDGLRRYVWIVRFESAAKSHKMLAPSSKFLIDRKLDLLRWASALPAFGPEALVAQLAIRPSSFASWADLVAHLARVSFMTAMTTGWLPCSMGNRRRRGSGPRTCSHAGGERERGMSLLDRCFEQGQAEDPIRSSGNQHRRSGLGSRVQLDRRSGCSAASCHREGVAVAGRMRPLIARHGMGRADAYDAALLDVAQDHLLYLLVEAGVFDDGSLTFKGGTSLRKCRLGNDGRFSTDLDFAAPDEDVVLAVCAIIDGNQIGGFQYRLEPSRGDVAVTGT